jgi:hypothetical protein
MKTEIQELFNKIDEVLSDRTYVETVYEDETGRHHGEMNVLDDLNCSILSDLIDELYDEVEKLGS